MVDLALQYDSRFGAWDLVLDGADLAADEGLETAVVLSLFNNARAKADDSIPDGTTNRRGWWADNAEPKTRPTALQDRHGSRLWLLSREKQTSSVLTRVQEYAAEALAWMVEDAWVKSVKVTASFPATGWCVFVVDLTKLDGTTVSYTHKVAWGA